MTPQAPPTCHRCDRSHLHPKAVSFIHSNLKLLPRIVQPPSDRAMNPRLANSASRVRVGRKRSRGNALEGEVIYFGRSFLWWEYFGGFESCRNKAQRANVPPALQSDVCTRACVFLSEFFISVNLCNYIPTEGGIKAGFICWDDEYDSALLYRLHICRQTHINLRLWWCCSEGCVIKHCYMRKWINL